jgi:hypothetical protein
MREKGRAVSGMDCRRRKEEKRWRKEKESIQEANGSTKEAKATGDRRRGRTERRLWSQHNSPHTPGLGWRHY